MDIEDVINPPIRIELTYPIGEPTESSDGQSRRAERDERHRLAIQAYNEEMRRRKAEDIAKFNASKRRHRQENKISILPGSWKRSTEMLLTHKSWEKNTGH